MKWDDEIGNRYRLTYKWRTVEVMAFDGRYWSRDGRARGVLIEMHTWMHDHWYVRPERMLYTREDIERMRADLSERMMDRIDWVTCDCGCDRLKPKDGWSSAWNQAASMVRCSGLPSHAAQEALKP